MRKQRALAIGLSLFMILGLAFGHTASAYATDLPTDGISGTNEAGDLPIQDTQKEQDTLPGTEDTEDDKESGATADGQGTGKSESQEGQEDPEADTAEGESEDKTDEEKEPLPTEHLIQYSGHCQTYGDQKAVEDGAILGTTGKAKRLEAIRISKGEALADMEGDIVYQVHAQTYGNMAWVRDGALAGTTGQAKRVEALRIYLTGELAENYDVYYTVHCQTYGWQDWTQGGTDESDTPWCGTTGKAKRIEAVQIKLVAKDPADPSDATQDPSLEDPDTEDPDTEEPAPTGLISYSGHQQSYGDLAEVSDGASLGVTGEAKRLEGIRIRLGDSEYTGSVVYRVHCQSYGWMEEVRDGAFAGTTGEAKRLEALEIRLTDELAEKYDIYYRVHAQSFGWLGWAKNGERAGTASLAKRLEAIEIQLVEKDAEAPGSTEQAFVSGSDYDVRIQTAVEGVYNSVGRDLYKCFMWCVRNIKYKHLGNVPSGYTSTQYYALQGFDNKQGDCRTYAATFYQLAKGLGYSPRYTFGYVPLARGGLGIHAWVEIDMNGTTYVFDPDFQYETGKNGYKFVYRTSGTWKYQNYHYED